MEAEVLNNKKMLVPKLRFKGFGGVWPNINLGEIAKFSKGKGLSKSDISDDGKLECIRYGELYTHYKETIDIIKSKTNVSADELVLSEKNDVIIPASGETPIDIATASCIIKSGVALGGDLNIIKTDNNGIFLSYYLNSKKKIDIANLSQGNSVVHLYSKQLALLNLNLPTLHEQQKIASFLSALDEKILKLTRKKELLEQYKKGVMQQLFSGKLRFKDENAEWSIVTIQKLIDTNAILSHLDGNHGGLYPRNEEFSSSGIPYISANDFIDGKVKFTSCKFLPIERAAKFKKGIAKDGDVLFAHNATVGPTAILKTAYTYVILSTTATYFRCDNKQLLNNYLKVYFETDNFIEQYSRVMSQSTRNQVPITMQRKFTIKLPPIDIQKKIADYSDNLDNKIEIVKNQITQTQTFKKGLLQQMFV